MVEENCSCKFCELTRDEMIDFIYWANLHIFQGRFKDMPNDEKQRITLAIVTYGMDEFNNRLSNSSAKILNMFVERVNGMLC
jgi:hypothetical protein